MLTLRICSVLIFGMISCFQNKENKQQQNHLINQTTDSSSEKKITDQIIYSKILKSDSNITLNINPSDLVSYAKSLIGTPYRYASTNIDEGLDCSGFITVVFNHFGKKVPRSSVDFTNYGREISMKQVKPGDLILFTGTDSTKRNVGHMGIITETLDTIKFIHSTSGKAYSVTITPLNRYYQGRFVKVIRVLK
ncbi:MAG TPA: C40 family peptidase [Pelobium sp.]|nr:C40 family peptidase [Pelobium sp.]